MSKPFAPELIPLPPSPIKRNLRFGIPEESSGAPLSRKARMTGMTRGGRPTDESGEIRSATSGTSASSASEEEGDCSDSASGSDDDADQSIATGSECYAISDAEDEETANMPALDFSPEDAGQLIMNAYKGLRRAVPSNYDAFLAKVLAQDLLTLAKDSSLTAATVTTYTPYAAPLVAMGRADPAHHARVNAAITSAAVKIYWTARSTRHFFTLYAAELERLLPLLAGLAGAPVEEGQVGVEGIPVELVPFLVDVLHDFGCMVVASVFSSTMGGMI
ncbi:hypothetical protein BC828DRAFT_402418 [Blastocladiella britannica]|nr:hypothetical protein BC828DRAFT_402418 [Blastocladiella britannica]